MAFRGRPHLRSDLLQIADVGLAKAMGAFGAGRFRKLIHRNVGLAAAAIIPGAAIRQSCAGSDRRMTKPTMEGFMSAAAQAFILTGELLVLSFAAIVAVWFADKLRRNFFGQG